MPSDEEVQLPELLRVHRDEILALWEAEVRAHLKDRVRSSPQLLDHIPEFLEEIAVAAGGPAAEEASPQETAEKHALERLTGGLDLPEVAIEYALLRSTLLRLLDRHECRLAPGQLELLNRTIDQALTQAIEAYREARERPLTGLGRMADAALDRENPAVFLPHLARILVETSAAADLALVLLRDGERLQVTTAIGVEPEVAMHHTQRLGEGVAGQVAVSRRPSHRPSAATDPEVLNAAIRAAGTRALYSVPLVRGEEVLGVLQVGSKSTHEFTREDRLLFRLTATRMSSLLTESRMVKAVTAPTSKDQRPGRVAEEEPCYELIFRSFPGMYLILSPDLRIVDATDLYARATLIQREEAVGRHMFEVFPDNPDNLERVGANNLRTSLERVLRTGQPDTMAPQRYDLRRPDGTFEERYWTPVNSPIFGPDGRLAYIVHRVEDVTEYLHVEQERAQEREHSVELESRPNRVETEIYRSAQQLQEKNEELRELSAALSRQIEERKTIEEDLQRTAVFRDQFIGILGHDLRNPLGAIRMSVDHLLRQELKEGQARIVRRIATSADRMSRMIADVLDFTRSRFGGGIPVEPKPIDLHHVISDAVDELQVAHADRDIRFQAEGSGLGEWDPDRLAQVVSNLVGNALQHGSEDSPVHVRVREDGADVLLEVTNFGNPIAPELLPVLFEPFRGAATRKPGTKGLGLGLWIVRKIVQAHGGSVQVSSTEDRGTTFTVRWPRRDGPYEG